MMWSSSHFLQHSIWSHLTFTQQYYVISEYRLSNWHLYLKHFPLIRGMVLQSGAQGTRANGAINAKDLEGHSDSDGDYAMAQI